MAKAGAPKKAKPRPKLSDKEQSERFKETAREFEVDQTGKAFEAALAKIIPAKSRRRNSATD